MIAKEEAKELLDFIVKKWDGLTFNSRNKSKNGNDPDDLLYLPNDYIVPNKEMFNAMFYWDSYFVVQGLRTEENRKKLIRGIVDNCLFEVENYGRVLNANRKKWSTRSQLPYLAMMVSNVYDDSYDKEWLKKAFDLVKKEYNKYWMDESHLTLTGLSRFYDESGVEPIGNYNKTHLYKSRSEASWDMSPRFGDDIHDLLPIDLNCNLFQYEKDFEKIALEFGDEGEALIWNGKAAKRKMIINDLMWSEEDGLFYDYNFRSGEKKRIRSLASYQAMFVGLAGKKQAEAHRINLKNFETDGGLAACTFGFESPDNQWDWPTVWAPLQYICYRGMEKYGFREETEKIAKNFIEIVFKNWKATGKIWEKYNGTTGDLAQISERYPTQSGFGWTNAVVEVFIREIYKI